MLEHSSPLKAEAEARSDADFDDPHVEDDEYETDEGGPDADQIHPDELGQLGARGMPRGISPSGASAVGAPRQTYGKVFCLGCDGLTSALTKNARQPKTGLPPAQAHRPPSPLPRFQTRCHIMPGPRRPAWARHPAESAPARQARVSSENVPCAARSIRWAIARSSSPATNCVRSATLHILARAERVRICATKNRCRS